MRRKRVAWTALDFINLAFPPLWHVAALVLVVPALGWAAWTAPWRRFEADAPAHVWYASLFCLTGLWSIRATLGAGVSLHLLGVPLFVLLAGFRLAFVGTALALVVATALRDGSWTSYGLNVLVMGATPALMTLAVLRAAERWLPAHLFIYFFVVAFFGAALAMLGAAGVALTIASTAGVLPASLSAELSLPLFANLALAEATITGMLITLLAVYQPTWVATYEAGRYSRRR